MKVVTIAAAKGGSGKTTVALSLAARATQDAMNVAMFDLNGDQGDLTKWWILRGEPMTPRIIDVENIRQDVAVLRESKRWDLLVVDCPPLDLDVIESAVIESDLVIVPCRPGFFDVDAVTPIVEICQRRKREYAFLLTAVDSKMPKLVETAMAALVSDGPILGTRLRYLQPYIQSLMKGRTASEIDRNCQGEIDNLWNEVKRLMSKQAPLSVVRGGRA